MGCNETPKRLHFSSGILMTVSKKLKDYRFFILEDDFRTWLQVHRRPVPSFVLACSIFSWLRRLPDIVCAAKSSYRAQVLNDLTLAFGHFYFVYWFLFSLCHHQRPPVFCVYHRRPLRNIVFRFYRKFFILSRNTQRGKKHSPLMSL